MTILPARAMLAATALLCATVLAAPARADSVGCLRPPVDAPIDRPFDAPPCPWCAGHRGLTYQTAQGTPVQAAAAGVVTFSGLVVDARYVVVRHGDGLLATYGGLESTTLASGDRVAAGATIGRSGPELYFGLRTGPQTYVDPEPLIGALVVPPYLVPTDGSPPRPPPEPLLRCAAGHTMSASTMSESSVFWASISDLGVHSLDIETVDKQKPF